MVIKDGVLRPDYFIQIQALPLASYVASGMYLPVLCLTDLSIKQS